MDFHIDYDRAKGMATKLQEYLDQNPREKLSRSSSIEAVARMLGFNNRNEMAATMGAEAPQKSADSAEIKAAPRIDLGDVSPDMTKAMRKALEDQIEICADILADATLNNSGETFKEASRSVFPDTYTTPFRAAASKIVRYLRDNKLVVVLEMMMDTYDRKAAPDPEDHAPEYRVTTWLMGKAEARAEEIWTEKRKDWSFENLKRLLDAEIETTATDLVDLVFPATSGWAFRDAIILPMDLETGDSSIQMMHKKITRNLLGDHVLLERMKEAISAHARIHVNEAVLGQRVNAGQPRVSLEKALRNPDTMVAVRLVAESLDRAEEIWNAKIAEKGLESGPGY